MADDRNPKQPMETGQEEQRHAREGEDPLQALMLRRSKLDASETALLRRVFSSMIKA